MSNILSLRTAGSGPDGVDVLLRNFFRAEMPHPWPVLKAPAEKVSPRIAQAAPARWTPVRSRLALAASVGFLVVGSWCLSAQLPEYANVNADSANDGTGTGFNRGAGAKIPKGSEKVKCPGCETPNK